MADRTCELEGCQKPSGQHRICGMHRKRIKRTGSADLLPRQPRQRRPRKPQAPYQRVRVAHHVLVDGCDSKTYVHRVVLFDRIGYGPHRCHWCCIGLTWRLDLHVDHIDFNRLNNDPDNLVPSCMSCNTTRPRPAITAA